METTKKLNETPLIEEISGNQSYVIVDDDGNVSRTRDVPGKYITETELSETIEPYNERITTNETDIVDIESYLDNLTPKNTASGELVHITDGLPLATFENKISGNYEQETTKGNQLLDFNTMPSSTYVTATFENDIFTVVGGENSIAYNSTSKYITTLIKNNPSKTLYFKFDKLETLVSANGTIGQLIITYNDGTAISYCPLITTLGASKGYTIPSDTSNIETATLGIYTSNNSPAITNTITITKPMLTFDENAEYEPYTGGQASPNPEYKQDIEVVEAYNLFNKDTLLKHTLLGKDGTTSVNTGVTVSTTDFIEIEGNEKYFLPNIATTRLKYFDSNKTVLTTNNWDITSSPSSGQVISTPSNAKYVRFSIDISAIDISIFVFSKGTTQKPYLPYGCIGYKVNGKNFFNTRKIKNKSDKTTIDIKNDNEIIVSTTENQSWVFYEFYIENLKKGKPYTFSLKFENSNTSLTNTYILMRGLTTNTTYYTDKYTNGKITFTPDDTTIFIRFNCTQGTALTNTTRYYDIQLEYGEVKTEYEPYQEQIVYLDLKGNFVGKINDTIKDYLVTDKKKLWLVKNVGKVVLNGSESWMLNGGTTDYGQYMNTSSTPDKAYGMVNIISDKFISKYSNNSNSIAGRDVNSYIFLTIAKSIVSFDLNVFKTWLSNNKVTVYYQLAEPQIIELGELPEPIKTFEGTNNIQLLANLDTEIEVKYAVDIKKYTDNKLAEISAQII